MNALCVDEGGIVSVLNVKLAKGSKCVLQPLLSDFTRLASPRVVLEKTLSRFSCLTVGETLPVHYLQKIYWLEVVLLEDGQKKSVNAVSIIETDISVEFMPAKDAKIEEKVEVEAKVETPVVPPIVLPATKEISPTQSNSSIFSMKGTGYRLDGKMQVANALESSRSDSSLDHLPQSRTASGNILKSEYSNGFRYVYEVTKGGAKKLVRREKVDDRPKPTGTGHSLRK